MEALVAGNTAYVDDEFCAKALPGAHVRVVSDSEAFRSDTPSSAGRGRRGWSELLGELEHAYEFERVIYLSSALTPHSESFGDLERLRRLFRACGSRAVRIIYIAGPMGVVDEDGVNRSGKAILGRAAIDLCRHYSECSHLDVKVLRVPYLYSAANDVDDPFLDPMFAQCSRGSIVFEGGRHSALPALCAEELPALLSRIFDAWTPGFETLSVAPCFNRTVGDLGEELERLYPGISITYGKDSQFVCEADDGLVRRRYGWFQRYDLLRDLSTLKCAWEAKNAVTKRPFQALIDRSRSHGSLLKLAETVAFWLLIELMVRAVSGSSQLDVIDYRVVFVVIVGTMYGLDFGILAAALACAGLVGSYLSTYGLSFQVLFYEPSNWLPFIAYFVVGAVCGYVQLRNSELIEVERDENGLLRSRNEFISTLYRDVSEDRAALKHQIVGRHDSFGKIFAVTRELDVLSPQEIYRKCCLIFQDILENDSVSLYHVAEGSFARLVAASPGVVDDVPRSLDLAGIDDVMGVLDQSGLWVNRSLEPGRPMFGYAIKRAGKPLVLIFIRNASEPQMTLYYQNLFSILCGLVESALLRAFEYEDAVRDDRHLEGSRVLAGPAFIDALAAEQDLKDDKMGDFLLMRVDPGAEPVAVLSGCIGRVIRTSDSAGLVDGVLYLLMRQARPSDLPAIEARLERGSIHATLLDPEDVRDLVRSHRAPGDSEGQVL